MSIEPGHFVSFSSYSLLILSPLACCLHLNSICPPKRPHLQSRNTCAGRSSEPLPPRGALYFIHSSPPSMFRLVEISVRQKIKARSAVQTVGILLESGIFPMYSSSSFLPSSGVADKKGRERERGKGAGARAT